MKKITITIEDEISKTNVYENGQRRRDGTSNGSNSGEGDDGRIKPPSGIPDNTQSIRH